MTISVLSGAVIHKDDGKSTVMYKEKCESCGYVSGSTKNTPFSSAQTTGSVYSSSFVCQKCKKRQEVKIKH